MRVKPEPIAEGQESVWSYPRPPLAEPSLKRLAVIHRGVTVADSDAVVRTLETSHPPTYYVPPSDVAMALLEQNGQALLLRVEGRRRLL